MTNDLHQPLTDEQVAFFQKEGYLGPFPAYSQSEIEDIWRRARLKTFDHSQSVFGKAESTKDPISSYDRHLDIDELADHVCHPAIISKLQQLLGRDVACWRSEFFPKYPGDEGTGTRATRSPASTGARTHCAGPKGRCKGERSRSGRRSRT